MNSVSFHPDSQIIASASTDQTIKLWSKEGKLLKTLLGHKDAVLAVAWSHDGKILASSSADKNKIRLWNQEGVLLMVLKGDAEELTSVSFSPDGKILAAGSGQGHVILRKLSDITLASLFKSNCHILKDYLLYNSTITRSDAYREQSYRTLCQND